MYMQTKNIALLMEIFNHSSEKVTLRYIGVNQDAMDKAMIRFKI
ncbi:DNA integration/recombination/inversion protein [Bacillus cereus]|nr:DNA integration/recombination/inversion protein [Bacillus cereus]